MGYTVGDDAYSEICEYTKTYGSTAAVICEEGYGGKAAEKLRAALSDQGIAHKLCRPEDEDTASQADMIFAAGGSEIVGICRLLSEKLDKPMFFLPDVCCFCPPKSEGREPVHVFLDPSVMCAADVKYLRSAIGAAILWYYEAGMLPSSADNDTIMSKAEQAYLDNKKHRDTEAFRRAAIALAVTSADEMPTAPSSNAAAPISGAAGAFVSAVRKLDLSCGVPDGYLYALGTLFALAYMGEMEEAMLLSRFNDRISLPSSLRDVGITERNAIVELADEICDIGSGRGCSEKLYPHYVKNILQIVLR